MLNNIVYKCFYKKNPKIQCNTRYLQNLIYKNIYNLIKKRKDFRIKQSLRLNKC